MSSPRKLLVISGATATGKSGLAVSLAEKYGGEVISADSVQVYRGMDIGSAKVTPEEMRGVPHHLIDILDPDEPYSVADFCARAREAIKDISSCGRLPIIAGGTGFYIRALLFDTDFDGGESDAEVRERLMAIARDEGADVLYERLTECDPDYAATVHPNNIKRVARALEYYELTGRKFSEYNEAERQRQSPYEYRQFILTMPRDILYPRINERVDAMMEAGLYDEVVALKAKGYARSLPSMQSIGYKEMYDCIEGDISLDKAIYNIKLETRHFAKRQETWFKREAGAERVDITECDPMTAVSEALADFL